MLMLEERDHIAWCGEQGIGVVAYGPLAYGLLTGAITAETSFSQTDFRGGHDEGDFWQKLFAPGKRERSFAVVDAMRSIAERVGCSVAQLALAWNFDQAGVTSSIAGSRNPAHVRSNATAGELELDATIRSELEETLKLGPAFA